MKTLSAALQVEQDPVKRELVQLVLEWLEAKAVAKRGGFVAIGGLRAQYVAGAWVDRWRLCTFLARLVSGFSFGLILVILPQ